MPITDGTPRYVAGHYVTANQTCRYPHCKATATRWYRPVGGTSKVALCQAHFETDNRAKYVVSETPAKARRVKWGSR